MNEKYNLMYSPEFLNDLDRIVSYIKLDLDNIIAAYNLLAKVEKRVKQRLKNPLGYEKFKTGANNTYYRIYVGRYIIFYTVSDYTMVVRRIIYEKRKIKKLL